MSRARRDKLALSIIATVRTNEWNVHGESLSSYVTHEYDLRYLSEHEVDMLLTLLNLHRCLGHLDGMPLDEQRKEFAQRAGRQLLVALQEATTGKPFSDILLDEYTFIPSEIAKTLYRTVCILDRLHVETRAGLIARVHGIPFTDFREHLFKPLELVVSARLNERIRDYVYRSRHPHIAEIVFERVMVDPQDRYDEYLRIISCLDVAYDADREALRRLTNAKHLGSLFSDPKMIRQLLARAHERSPDSASLHQQEAIFEMTCGALARAGELLAKAKNLNPGNAAIDHSLSELALKNAHKARTTIERQKFRADARQIASRQIGPHTTVSHPWHTLLKLTIEELKEALEQQNDTAVTDKIKELEKLLSAALRILSASVRDDRQRHRLGSACAATRLPCWSIGYAVENEGGEVVRTARYGAAHCEMA